MSKTASINTRTIISRQTGAAATTFRMIKVAVSTNGVATDSVGCERRCGAGARTARISRRANDASSHTLCRYCARVEDAILGSTCEELSEGVADVLGIGAGVELDDGEGVGDGGAELLEDDEDKVENETEGEAEVETDMALESGGGVDVTVAKESEDGRADDDVLDETP